MSVTPTRIGRSEASAKTETSAPEECFSCRLWGGLAHLGIAGYLVSCCNAKQTRLGRISILSFAAGKMILTFFDERLKEKEMATNFYKWKIVLHFRSRRTWHLQPLKHLFADKEQ